MITVAPDRILVRPRSYYPSMKGPEAEASEHPEYASWKVLLVLVLLAALGAVMILGLLLGW